MINLPGDDIPEGVELHWWLIVGSTFPNQRNEIHTRRSFFWTQKKLLSHRLLGDFESSLLSSGGDLSSLNVNYLGFGTKEEMGFD